MLALMDYRSKLIYVNAVILSLDLGYGDQSCTVEFNFISSKNKNNRQLVIEGFISQGWIYRNENLLKNDI